MLGARDISKDKTLAKAVPNTDMELPYQEQCHSVFLLAVGGNSNCRTKMKSTVHGLCGLKLPGLTAIQIVISRFQFFQRKIELKQLLF